MARPIRVWRYRGWCWVCRHEQTTHDLWPCAGGGGYDSAAAAGDAGRAHLRDHHRETQ